MALYNLYDDGTNKKIQTKKIILLCAATFYQWFVLVEIFIFSQEHKNDIFKLL